MDPIRRFFENADIVVVGDYSKHICTEHFEKIKNALDKIQEETGLRFILTEFYVYGKVKNEKWTN